jgi:methylphosphotriester-DNA--protein-cysteine methyltransferase
MGPFYGSSKSTIYHVGGCEWASRIQKDNVMLFNSREAAESKSYRPCKVCRPEEMKVFSSVQSDKYHLWSCEWTGRMLVQNIRAFKSPKDAQAAGHKACEVCRP